MTPSTPDLRDKFAAHVRTGAPCPVPGGVQLCGPHMAPDGTGGWVLKGGPYMTMPLPHPAPAPAPVAPVVEYPIDFGPGSIHAEALARELAPVVDGQIGADGCIGGVPAHDFETDPLASAEHPPLNQFHRAVSLLWRVQNLLSSETYSTGRHVQGGIEEYLEDVDPEQEMYPPMGDDHEPTVLVASALAERDTAVESVRVLEEGIQTLLLAREGGGSAIHDVAAFLRALLEKTNI